VKGAAEMIAKLKQIQAKFPDRVAAALYQIAQQIMTEAKRRCPVASDGGTLRASGLVSEPVRSGRSISVTLSFGGAADAYAISVHETPGPHDPPSWKIMYERGGMISYTTPGTGSKFLESVINEYVPVMPTLMAALLNLDDESVFS
jgi:hypothetical protein